MFSYYCPKTPKEPVEKIEEFDSRKDFLFVILVTLHIVITLQMFFCGTLLYFLKEKFWDRERTRNNRSSSSSYKTATCRVAISEIHIIIIIITVLRRYSWSRLTENLLRLKSSQIFPKFTLIYEHFANS